MGQAMTSISSLLIRSLFTTQILFLEKQKKDGDVNQITTFVDKVIWRGEKVNWQQKHNKNNIYLIK